MLFTKTKKTLSMQFVSFVTMLVLVAGSPAPAFIAYAQEAPAPEAPAPVVEAPAPEPAPAPAPEPTPAPEPAPEPAPQTTETTPPAETPAPAPETQTLSETQNNPPAENGENGAPSESGGSGENGAGAEPPAPAPDGQATVIDTGNASSGGTATTEANNTVINTDTPNGGSGSTDAASTTPSSGGGGSSSPVTIDLGNTLSASSTATSTAETGDNAANDPDGVLIDTGRADAFGYLISLFNVAVTNSHGSILFLRNPLGSALDFTQRIMDIFSNITGGTNGACSFLGCSLADAAFNIFTDNAVDITNTLVVRSATGGNDATSSDGAASIDTGNARAFGGIVNFGNLQIVDSRYLVILMNNAGNLNGNILLPEGDFFKRLSSGAALARGSSLDVSNTADIANNATTTAETGANGALGENSATIDTGNANAQTSALNFVNQIGSPMCFIVTVGGAWNGDVIQLPEGFSREETSFGEIICGACGGEDRSSARENFHASTTNYARVLTNAIVEATSGNNTAEGFDAAIRTGNASAFLQILNVVNQTIIGQDWIFALFTVSGDWNGNLVFGTVPGEPDVLEQLIEQYVTAHQGGAQGGYEPDITFTKNASVLKTTSPATVDYEIIVDNKGGPARQVFVVDTLTAPDGHVLGNQRWNLGPLAQNEKVTITYTVQFDGELAPGYYTNTAVMGGQKNMAIGLDSMTASDVVEILPRGEVLGVAAAPQCEPLLTKYIRPGRPNNPAQVQLLQSFLNSSEGEELEPTGIYDAATIAAVNRFQMKYATDILDPWGIDHATSNAYYTTQRKVNALYCKDESKFELTTEQLLEISKFKAQLSVPDANVDDLLKNNDVGKKKSKPTAKIPLMMPPPALPVIFKEPVSEKNGKPVSMMSLPLHLLSSWLYSAVPTVEAMER